MSEPTTDVQVRHRIDLNADLAEGFGRWTFGTDDDLLDIVTSANVACGFHAGDPTVIRRAVVRAVTNGVRIGAHVGYPDLAGFGRRQMVIPRGELADLVAYQLAALSGIARAEGGQVRYVKPHGALYNTAVHDPEQAAAIVDAILRIDPSLAVMSLPGSVLLETARAHGLSTIHEAFADRAYLADGRLAPRSMEGSVIHDPQQVADRVVRIVTQGRVEALDGGETVTRPTSICVHGDSPGAVALARRVRTALSAAGVEVAPAVDDATGDPR
ncbi:MAG: 5-oxoprolinase subunit PxpA [Aeromicrobium sp.]